MPVLRIPTPLRAYTNGQSDVTVSGANISETLTDLTAQYPALKPPPRRRRSSISPTRSSGTTEASSPF